MTPTHRERLQSALRVPELAVGSFIVAASIGGAVIWQKSVENGTAVLVTARDVARGQVLGRGDLSQVVLTSSADIALIRASSAAQVVGRRVTADLVQGTPLTPAFLTELGVFGLADALVGFALPSSSAPAELSAGDSVRVFTVQSTPDGGTLVDEVPGPIEVWEVSISDPLSNDRAVTVKSPIESVPRFFGSKEIHLVKVSN